MRETGGPAIWVLLWEFSLSQPSSPPHIRRHLIYNTGLRGTWLQDGDSVLGMNSRSSGYNRMCAGCVVFISTPVRCLMPGQPAWLRLS